MSTLRGREGGAGKAYLRSASLASGPTGAPDGGVMKDAGRLPCASTCAGLALDPGTGAGSGNGGIPSVETSVATME